MTQTLHSKLLQARKSGIDVRDVLRITQTLISNIKDLEPITIAPYNIHVKSAEERYDKAISLLHHKFPIYYTNDIISNIIGMELNGVAFYIDEAVKREPKLNKYLHKIVDEFVNNCKKR